MKLTDYQRELLIQASKTPGTQEDKVKAIDTVIETLKSINPEAFQPFQPDDSAPTRSR